VTHVVLFTDDPDVEDRFAAIDRSRSCRLSVRPSDTLSAAIGEITDDVVCYVDVGSYTSDIKRFLRDHAGLPTLRIAIVDRYRAIRDVSELIRLGAVDYLGPELLEEEVSTKRIKSILEYRPFAVATDQSPIGEHPWRLVPDATWSRVESGQEYTFVLLYIEIDIIDEWRRKSGKDLLNDVKASFHRHVELETSQRNGKVWMWTDLGGIVLFPFDGKSCPIIETCMKLVLDRTIISAEHFTYNTLITYRMAIHIGNTVYRTRGNTGTIISDAVNFMFHLGQKCLERGNLIVTDAAAAFIEPGLRSCFVPAGTFEKVDITRMRLPIR
jgi:hypothetical protein